MTNVRDVISSIACVGTTGKIYSQKKFFALKIWVHLLYFISLAIPVNKVENNVVITKCGKFKYAHKSAELFDLTNSIATTA